LGKKFLEATGVNLSQFLLNLDVPSHRARCPHFRAFTLDLPKHQRKLAHGEDAIDTRFVEQGTISTEDLTKETLKKFRETSPFHETVK
jgi:hypothetical protein